MEQEKRLQVFVSSTYEDLKVERQAAVTAILSAGHIPAGMELFAAGDQSQLDVIREWIKQSDVFMLILAGRYGSIEPKSNKSYIHLEYEYAIQLKKPLFSVVISEAHLDRKIKELGKSAIETINPAKFTKFKKMVTKHLVDFWDDPRDIELAVHKSLASFKVRPDLVGWRRGGGVEEVKGAVGASDGEVRLAVAPRQRKEVRGLPAGGSYYPRDQGSELKAEELEDVGSTSLGASFELALGNITHHGDTDVFPFPVESLVFFDHPVESIRLLESLHHQSAEGFRRSLGGFMHEEGLVSAGYAGFRWATQMDPLWNAYLLGLVIEIGPEIEAVRVPVAKEVVFSYRFKPDSRESTLFDRDIGWPQFQKTSLDLVGEYSHVLICDIADYYLHINHQHLNHALKRATSRTYLVQRIMALLTVLSKGVGYGLPVGGPAARLLSELLLNDIDRHLLSAQIKFHRFVDDFHVFARSEEEARSHLAYLSELLLVNDSLPLQKSKTRILSAEEFRSLYDPGSAEGEVEVLDRQVLKLRLHFDYFSETRQEDYEALKEEMSRYPIEEMLARQMRKSRIDQAVTKKLIQMVRFQDAPVRNHTVDSLLDNLDVLYPVFPTVMVLLKGVMPELGDDVRQRSFEMIRELIAEGSPIVKITINLAFAVRMLAQDKSDETVQVLANLYKTTSSMLLRRDIILAMARNRVAYWTSAHLRDFDKLTPWERRALIIASHTLDDEGRDFRRSLSDRLHPLEQLVSSWASQRLEKGQLEIPL